MTTETTEIVAAGNRFKRGARVRTSDTPSLLSVQKLENPSKENKTSLEPLHPDAKRMETLEQSHPQNIPSLQQKDRSQIFKVMNALRTLGPAIGLAMTIEGEQNQIQKLNTIIHQARAWAGDMLTALEIDESDKTNLWMVAMLERTFVEVLTQHPTLLGTALPEEVKKHSIKEASEMTDGDPLYTTLGEELHVRLALTQAIAPIYALSVQYPKAFFLLDWTTENWYDFIFEHTLIGVQKLAPALTPAAERRTTFTVLSSELSKSIVLFLTPLFVEYEKMAQKMTSESLQQWKEREQAIIQKGKKIIEQRIEVFFHRLIQMSEKISNTKK